MAFSGEEVVETESFVFFWKPPAPFSQWTRSHFVIDEQEYTHAEQWMMAAKASLFGDSDMLARILASDDPRSQKRLGQQVRGFDEDTWKRERLDIVVRGNEAKFGQSQKLRRILLATGDKTLVEASPIDRIWGIGLRADDPRAQRPSEWRGLNLLGEALMRVRALLARCD